MTNAFDCAFVTVDDGSGNIKMVTQGNDGQLITRTQSSAIAENYTHVIGASVADCVWSIEGVPFSVMPDYKDLAKTTDKNYQSSLASRVLVNDTVSRLNIEKPIVLAVTIPTCHYFTNDANNRINIKAIEKKRQNLLAEINNMSGNLTAPSFAAIKVYPEAVPAYVYCSRDELGKRKDGYDDQHETLIVDLGHFTCDLAFIKDGLNVTKMSTTEHGVHTLLRKLRNALIQDSDFTMDLDHINDVALSQILQRGFFGSAKSENAYRYDISDLVTTLKNELYAEIFNDIETLLGKDAVKYIDRVIIVGGGAYLIGNIAKDNKLNGDIVVPNEPEFAIAKGTHLMLLSQAENIKATLAPQNAEQNQTSEKA